MSAGREPGQKRLRELVLRQRVQGIRVDSRVVSQASQVEGRRAWPAPLLAIPTHIEFVLPAIVTKAASDNWSSKLTLQVAKANTVGVGNAPHKPAIKLRISLNLQRRPNTSLERNLAFHALGNELFTGQYAYLIHP